MVLESLREEFYAAALAGASISMTEHSRGITLSLSGYSDKQEVLLNEVLRAIKKFTFSSDQFLATRDSLTRRFKNFDQRTLAEKAQVELNALLFSPTWHPDELLSTSQTLTKAQLVDFKAVFWKSCHVEMLVHGNYDANQARQFASLVEKVFPSRPRISSAKPAIKIAELAKGAKHYRQIPSHDKNHVVMWYMQNQKKDYDTLAKTLLLSNLIEVPYFQTLRVDKQLAYSLGAHPLNLKKVSGLLFWIQSAKAEPNVLLHEIKQFLRSYPSQLEKMDEQTFMTSREALVAQMLQLPRTLGEQTQRWWSVLENGERDFDYNEHLATAIEKINRTELSLFAQSMFDLKVDKGQLFVLSGPLSPLTTEKEIASIQEFRENAPFIG